VANALSRESFCAATIVPGLPLGSLCGPHLTKIYFSSIFYDEAASSARRRRAGTACFAVFNELCNIITAHNLPSKESAADLRLLGPAVEKEG
jgi:hypothetical protein